MAKGRRFPFGMDGPFDGLRITEPRSGKALLRYVPNDRQYEAHNCCCDEIFYGGAVYGGKSFWILMHNAAHCLQYGEYANTVIFRRTFDELEGSIILEQRDLFENEHIGTYKTEPHLFQWNNGAKTWFRHLQDEDALRKHKSRQYTLVAFDELTDFLEEQYLFLFQRLRSPKVASIHPQILSASNPRGPGHRWVYERFIKGREPGKVYLSKMEGYSFGDFHFPGRQFSRIFVPARATDNVEGLKNDPEYLGRMKETQSPEMFEAYVEGNWETFEGMAFPDWDPAVHVCAPFQIPDGWKVLRALDWGYTAPFSFGLWAQDPETKTIYRVDEWYGGRKGPQGGVHGLEMTPPQVRQGIVDREAANVSNRAYPRPWYGVADAQLWERQASGWTVGDQLNAGGTLFRAAPKGPGSRVAGKNLLHSLLRVDPKTGKPGLQVFSTCRAFIEQIPSLVLDERTLEDVSDKQEDHVYDEARYALTELAQSPASRESVGAQSDYYAAKLRKHPVLV